ncbi:M20 family metallo-hydrolase [Halotalea alkalilenta]|uniref:Zn-dependent hydrolase n=1 Tax=Halotalea alkalilenta TaxID=376489 RepID=A0A172YCE4_9GAMM|nr:M20 family metallo-hydrolase [Halotalea alkalilenta]ANF56903.1 Zn-dependent hydrolase [Halotalea alkalilenta]
MTAVPQSPVVAPSIDSQRLWSSLMEMAEIGKTPGGGSGRLALSESDGVGRRQLIEWAEALGCSVTIDEIGNLFIRREGKRPELDPVAFGSHLDTQPLGGRFDGVLGVLAGLEVLRTLDAAGIVTERPLLLVDWTNEEGSRFSPAMISSGVYAGVFDKQYMLSRTDRDGVTQGEALRAIGFEGSAPIGEPRFARFFELHIEQGPVLEDEALEIGVVDGVQGISWYDVCFSGQAAHSGTTPLRLRHDALRGASRMIDRLLDEALEQDPDAKITFGELDIVSPSRNVVPAQVRLTVDLRHLDDQRLASLEARFLDHLARATEHTGVEATYERIWHSPAVRFDADCVAMVEDSARQRGLSFRRMPSGAGHDSVYVARVAPTSMIFIPCLGGISHNEAEYSSPEQCAAGCQVLCDAVVRAAG